MQITTNAKLISWRKEEKENRGKKTESITAHIERLDQVPAVKAPYNTRPGAYITFTDKAYLIDGQEIRGGEHVSITFLLSCGEYKGNFYTKLTGVDIEKIDLQSPKNSLFDTKEDDEKFDWDPITKTIL